MNFRVPADMLVLFPKRVLAVWDDLSMPHRNWSRFDPPPDAQRKANVAKWKLDRARKGR